MAKNARQAYAVSLKAGHQVINCHVYVWFETSGTIKESPYKSK